MERKANIVLNWAEDVCGCLPVRWCRGNCHVGESRCALSQLRAASGWRCEREVVLFLGCVRRTCDWARANMVQ